MNKSLTVLLLTLCLTICSSCAKKENRESSIPILDTQEPPGQVTSLTNKTECIKRPQWIKENSRLDFGIYWPMRDPTVNHGAAKPLLQGKLKVNSSDLSTEDSRLMISIELTRPDDPASRKNWNRKLMYKKYNWMSTLRVWDREHQWLYPNLTYLFKLHGNDRTDRYGGWDKGHRNDNDFGAILIRRYDETGKTEDPDSEITPLVSAGWKPQGEVKSGKHDVVHSIESDTFHVHMKDPGTKRAGHLKIWLIYADFMEDRAPESWPKTKEYKGGILSFFQVDWKLSLDNQLYLRTEHKIPDRDTDFDWEAWVNRDSITSSPEGEAILTDRL